MVRFALAAMMQLPVHQVRAVNGDIGGSFGQKSSLRSEDLAICVASKLLDRPVKWIEDRAENLTVAGHARDERFDVEAAIDDDGNVLGVRIEVVLDQGAYPLPSVGSKLFTDAIRVIFPSAYRIRDMEFDAKIVFTNKATYGAYRGPWAAETWVRERLLDLIAHEVGVDPVEVRRRNLLRDDEMGPMITGPTLSGITLRDGLDKAERVAGYAAFREEQARARADGRYLGLGVAIYIEPAPGPPDYGPTIGFVVPPERASSAARARRNADRLHEPGAARPEPRDDARPGRRRHARRAVRVGARRPRRQQPRTVLTDGDGRQPRRDRRDRLGHRRHARHPQRKSPASPRTSSRPTPTTSRSSTESRRSAGRPPPPSRSRRWR